jgi:hypothetical protein
VSKDNSRARSTDRQETCQAVPAPSRRGLLAGAGLAGGAISQLFVTEAIAAGANATLERLKGTERDPAHRVLLNFILSSGMGCAAVMRGLVGCRRALAPCHDLSASRNRANTWSYLPWQPTGRRCG